MIVMTQKNIDGTGLPLKQNHRKRILGLISQILNYLPRIPLT